MNRFGGFGALLSATTLIVLPSLAWQQNGRSYAVLVGVSKYDDRGIQWLKYAGRDATLFQTWLSGRDRSARIRVLEEGKASAASVRETLRDVLTVQAGPLDDVYLFLSGRGLGTPDYSAGFILTPESKESRPTSTALSTEELGLFIRQSQAKRIFLFADLCREPEAVYRRNLIQFKLKDLASTKSPLLAILGSQPEQFSAELDDQKYGAFSYFLVKGLQAGNLTGAQLMGYLKQQLPKSSPTRQSAWQFGSLPAQANIIVPLRPNAQSSVRSRPKFLRVLFSPPQEDATDALHQMLLTAVQSDPDRAKQLFLAADRTVQQQERTPFSVALEDRGQNVLVKYGEGDQFPNEPGRPGKHDFEIAARAFDLARDLQSDPQVRESLDARRLFSEGRALLFDAKSHDEYDKAQQALNAAITRKSEYPESWNAIGIAHLEQAEYDEATQYFQQAIQRAPDWAYPRHNLALTYIETGNYNGAEREYREAIRRTPYNAYLYYNLGLLLHRVNRKADANTEYKGAVKVFEDQAAMAGKRAERSTQDGDVAHAREATERRATLLRNEAEVHNAMGALAQAERHDKASLEEYEAARRLDPDLILATYNLGTLVADKDPARAIQLWKETLSKNADYIPSHLRLGELYSKQKQFGDAISEYREVMRLQPTSEAKSRLAEALGDAAAAKGNTTEACAQYRSAEKSPPLAKKLKAICRTFR